MSLMARCKKLTIRVLTITPSNLKLSFGVVRVKIIPGGGGKYRISHDSRKKKNPKYIK